MKVRTRLITEIGYYSLQLKHRFLTGVRRVVLGGPRRSQTSSILPIYTSFKVIQGSISSVIDALGVRGTFFKLLVVHGA